MEFRILGPLEVVDDGRPISIRRGKEQALLIYLLLHANEVVPSGRLIDALWDERPPPTAPKILQNAVSHLRKELGDGRLVTRDPGYVLRVEEGELDMQRFERFAKEGRGVEALALWRGPALLDLREERFADDARRRLEEQRVAVLEDRIDEAVTSGIVGRTDDRLAFTHPLFRHACYTSVATLMRKSLHLRIADALIATGELEDAAGVLARLEEDAERSDGRWSRGVAARCRALLYAVERRPDEALDAAERSLLELDGVPAPFERARTLLVTGQIRRRRKEKRPARDALRAALAMFEELATPIWAEHARAELARIPERGKGTELTPTEERIARLAADGLTNKEIADRSFLSPKTVEVNLTRVYRKLGVRSRTALAGRFAGERPVVKP